MSTQVSTTFMQKYGAYIYTAIGLGVVGTIFVGTMMIMDWGYLLSYAIQVVTTGNLDGVVTAPQSNYDHFVNSAFGPAYTSIASEIVRASNERQAYIWYIFLAEILIFAVVYAMHGRKEATITKPNDLVRVFTPFQLFVIWGNIAIVIFLIISGFNITWGLRSEGGDLPRLLRASHEMMGIIWFPFWLLASIMVFKDAKMILKHSSFGFFMPGDFKPMKRVIYVFFVAMGAGLLVSGFLIYYIHPNSLIHAETIQFKRALLYVHFGASVLIMFFLFDLVYSSVIATKGYFKGLLSGKYPREYLEQLYPDILEDLEKTKKA